MVPKYQKKETELAKVINEGRSDIFHRLTGQHDPCDIRVALVAYHHFQRKDLPNANKGPEMFKDKPETPQRNSLPNNLPAAEEEVKIGKNRGKLYFTPNNP